MVVPLTEHNVETPEDPLDLMDEIDELKREKDATILAHYYVDGEIQDIADFTGDSLQLARDATTVTTSTIVFSGVHFMGESARIMNPEKTVLIPDLLAGCSLAESCPPNELDAFQKKLRAQGREIVTVAYINTSAAVKSLCDWIVTSGNAREIIERIPDDREILFVPDQHLGQYLTEVTGHRIILQDMLRAKRNNPGSIVVAHPECPRNILDASDFIGGTEKIRRYVSSIEDPATILVATEPTMIHPLQKAAARHTYIPVPGIMTSTGETCACNRCPHMARNTLQKVRDCLRNGAPEIHWQPCFERAREVLEKSLLE